MANLSTDPLVLARDENGDLIVPIRTASGLEAVLVLVRAAVKLWRDEYFLNRAIGMPWLETEDGAVPERDAILGQPHDPGKILRALRGEILKIPNTTDITEFSSVFDGSERGVSVSFVVKTRFGDSDLITVDVGT